MHLKFFKWPWQCPIVTSKYPETCGVPNTFWSRSILEKNSSNNFCERLLHYSKCLHVWYFPNGVLLSTEIVYRPNFCTCFNYFFCSIFLFTLSLCTNICIIGFAARMVFISFHFKMTAYNPMVNRLLLNIYMSPVWLLCIQVSKFFVVVVLPLDGLRSFCFSRNASCL